MSNSKPLLATITSSIGMLLGGLLGAAGGSFAGNELVVNAGFGNHPIIDLLCCN